MSLNYDLTKVDEKVWRLPSPEKSDETILNPITHSLIFGTISTGLGEITEKNYIEFWLRYKSADIISPWPGEPTKITLEDVKDHIGLRTNVFPNESRSKWIKRIFDNDIREYEYRERRKNQEAA